MVSIFSCRRMIAIHCRHYEQGTPNRSGNTGQQMNARRSGRHGSAHPSIFTGRGQHGTCWRSGTGGGRAGHTGRGSTYIHAHVLLENFSGKIIFHEPDTLAGDHARGKLKNYFLIERERVPPLPYTPFSFGETSNGKGGKTKDIFTRA